MERPRRPAPVRGGQGGRAGGLAAGAVVIAEAAEETGAVLPEADRDEGAVLVAAEQEEAEKGLNIFIR